MNDKKKYIYVLSRSGLNVDDNIIRLYLNLDEGIKVLKDWYDSLNRVDNDIDLAIKAIEFEITDYWGHFWVSENVGRENYKKYAWEVSLMKFEENYIGTNVLTFKYLKEI